VRAEALAIQAAGADLEGFLREKMQVRGFVASDLHRVHALLATHGWAHRIGDLQNLDRLISASQRAVVAVADDQVIGFARAITDGISNGYLSMLVVCEGHRRQGVGRALVECLVGAESNITWVLRAEREGAAQFFAKLGFQVSTSAMERPRR
jgi:GNAT superfamily N-acetyltransferase